MFTKRLDWLKQCSKWAMTFVEEHSAVAVEMKVAGPSLSIDSNAERGIGTQPSVHLFHQKTVKNI